MIFFVTGYPGVAVTGDVGVAERQVMTHLGWSGEKDNKTQRAHSLSNLEMGFFCHMNNTRAESEMRQTDCNEQEVFEERNLRTGKLLLRVENSSWSQRTYFTGKGIFSGLCP